jgi:hypothetical protein
MKVQSLNYVEHTRLLDHYSPNCVACAETHTLAHRLLCYVDSNYHAKLMIQYWPAGDDEIPMFIVKTDGRQIARQHIAICRALAFAYQCGVADTE